MYKNIYNLNPNLCHNLYVNPQKRDKLITWFNFLGFRKKENQWVKYIDRQDFNGNTDARYGPDYDNICRAQIHIYDDVDLIDVEFVWKKWDDDWHRIDFEYFFEDKNLNNIFTHLQSDFLHWINWMIEHDFIEIHGIGEINMILYPNENAHVDLNYVIPASVRKESPPAISTAWRNGYGTGKFEAIMDLTGGHKCKHPKEIIYCKDCEYSYTYEYPESGREALQCKVPYLEGDLKDNDYCSYAELKENNYDT